MACLWHREGKAGACQELESGSSPESPSWPLLPRRMSAWQKRTEKRHPPSCAPPPGGERKGCKQSFLSRLPTHSDLNRWAHVGAEETEAAGVCPGVSSRVRG